MAELVELFVTELPARINALRAAWVGRQLTDLARLTHQLKGAGSGYGFPAIGDAAGKFEEHIRGLNDSEAALDALSSQFRDLVDLCARACARH
jgi:HPt (histidine-containing phosphotransfer) domain-containing protein